MSILLLMVQDVGLCQDARPLTHDSIPRLTDHHVAEMQEAEQIPEAEEPQREKAGLYFFELAVTQMNVLPAYRERYKQVLFSLADIYIEDDPSELWNGLNETDPISEEFIGNAFMIAMYEMFYGNSKWTQDGTLEIHNDTKGVYLRILHNNQGTASEIRPISVLRNLLNEILNKPWTRRDFGYPLLAGIDTDKVIVRQAFWDDDYETLLFTLEPIGDAPVLTTIIIENIYTNYLAILLQNGEYRAAIDEHAQVAGEHTRNLDPGQIEVQVRLDGLTRFTLKPME